MEKLNTNDELEYLADVFNEMLDRMRRYIEQQESFVSDVSHELRTPVAIIEGHLSMLNRWGKDDPEVLNEGLEASLTEVKRMKSLVSEMLDLSRAGSMNPELLEKTSEGRKILLQVVNNFRLLYPEFKIELNDQVNDEVEVKMYRNHLEQLIIIILENAIKYSTDKKEIIVEMKENDKYFEFSIQDFGEGMTEEEAKKIFDRFYRVDKARARETGGNGLGLSIAKEIITAYKGEISVASIINQGTTFYISVRKA
jgi:signal transduction histidine kinase